jgi:hypothetical protein
MLQGSITFLMNWTRNGQSEPIQCQYQTAQPSGAARTTGTGFLRAGSPTDADGR